MLDPLSIGLLAAAVLAALATASWAALKGWQGWLELKRFELTHGAADHKLPPATGRMNRG